MRVQEFHRCANVQVWESLPQSLGGIHHNISKTHLHRYMAKFEFRHNGRFRDDGERTIAAIKSAEGKRLMYKQSIRQSTQSGGKVTEVS